LLEDAVDVVGSIVELDVAVEDDGDDVDKELDVEVNEVDEEVGEGAGTSTVTGELTSIMEYPVAVTVFAIGDGVIETTTILVESGPSIVVVEVI